MLGNFSFGDYFKRDAIAFAWELVTSPEWLGIPKDRLYVTIFEGDPANGVPRDDEAEGYWVEAGVPKTRIRQYGLKDNFWQMGETGPCGPCSEIFYDMGMEAAGPPGSTSPSARTTPATWRSGTWSSCSSIAPRLWTRDKGDDI